MLYYPKAKKPGRILGLHTEFQGISVGNSYIYLWQNLDILEGSLYKDLLEEGMDFFALDILNSHPVERDLAARVVIQKSPDPLLLLMKQMNIDFSPTDYLDKDILSGYAQTLTALPHKQKVMIIAQKICLELAKDTQTLSDILSKPSVEDWDRVIGFYRTRQPLAPGPGYSIGLHSSIYSLMHQ